MKASNKKWHKYPVLRMNSYGAENNTFQGLGWEGDGNTTVGCMFSPILCLYKSNLSSLLLLTMENIFQIVILHACMCLFRMFY